MNMRAIQERGPIGSTQGICSIEGCGKRIKAKGWCAMHHQRYRRTGDPLKLPGRSKPTCVVKDCTGVSYSSYPYCYHHTYRWKRYGDPLAGRVVLHQCTVEGCNLPHRAKGLCGKHYNAQRYDKLKKEVRG